MIDHGGAPAPVWASVWDGVREDFSDLPDTGGVLRVALRLLVAVTLGALLGAEREWTGKPAGLRTHMLVTLGAALFVVVPQMAGMDAAALSRVIQGLVAGIGFIGGGSILKLSDEKRVRGMTTAAGIWVAAAVGVAAGLGRLWSALLGAATAFIILWALGRLERRVEGRKHGSRFHPPPGPGPTSGSVTV